jgi:hypothetical protein
MNYARAGVAIVALALFVRADPAAGELSDWSEEAGFSLQLPAGWTAERDMPGRGAVLRPPDAGQQAVELVVWRVSVGVVNVQGAAAEHERLLRARMPYERLRSEPISTAGAGEGLYVEGSVELADGGSAAALFAVFMSGDRAYVVGTFSELTDTKVSREKGIEPVLRGLFLGREVPSLEPWTEQTPRRPAEPPIAPVAPLVRQPGTGVTPADSGPADGHTPREGPSEPDDGGTWFSVDLLPEWQVEADRDLVCISSPGDAMALLLPVVCTGRDVGRAALEQAVVQMLTRAGAAEIVACRECSRDGTCAWVWSEVTVGGKIARGPFALVVEEPVGLLAGVVSPAEDPGADLRAAAHIIASFRARCDREVVEAGITPGNHWVDPSGALECTLPEGWEAEGGVLTYDGAPAISIRGRQVGGSRAWFTWLQPIRPVFRDLTESMRGLGFRDGDPYYAYDGVDRRMVMTRGAPAELVARYLLPTGLVLTESAKALGREESGDSLGLLGSGDERSAVVSIIDGSGTDAQQAWCAVSQRTTEPSRGGWFWEAACLAFGGCPGEGRLAARALEASVESAHVSEDCEGERAGRLRSLVQQAEMARSSTLWKRLVGGAAILPAGLADEGRQSGGDIGAVPEAASELWAGVAAGLVEPCKGIEVTALHSRPER